MTKKRFLEICEFLEKEDIEMFCSHLKHIVDMEIFWENEYKSGYKNAINDLEKFLKLITFTK